MALGPEGLAGPTGTSGRYGVRYGTVLQPVLRTYAARVRHRKA